MVECELPDYNPPDSDVRDILLSCRTIAVVGLSPKPARDSYRVAAYLIEQGYDVIPVNPGQKEILGKRCFRSLLEIPFGVDLADLFVNPQRVPTVVEQAMAKGIGTIWMQVGIVHNQCARKAREAGHRVVMNRCTMTDHKRMLGGGLA